MAGPSYTTNLTDFATADESSGWTEMTTMSDGTVAHQETDYFIQGQYCVSGELKSITKTGYASIVWDNSTGVTVPSPGAFLTWFKFLGPNVLNSEAAGGVRFVAGDSTSDFYHWYVLGNDTYAYGGWVNLAVDPVNPATNADTSTGSPTGVWSVAGIGLYPTVAISKGNPTGVDCIRYGRCDAVFEHGESGAYCTFAGFAASNDSNVSGAYNRWGLIQAIAGGYLWKGLMTIGTASNGASFVDSNVNITIDNTKKVVSSFNAIEINNTGTVVDWTGINISSLCTVSPGTFKVVDNAVVNLTNCNFADMGSFDLQTNTTVTNTNFRRCSTVTQAGAVLDECTFDSSSASVACLASNIDNIDNCSFTHSGTGLSHAIELTTDHAGGSYTITGCTYSGYAVTDGSTGDEAIYNNSGGAVTLNISGGDEPTIRNGTSASTTVVSGSVTVTATVQTATGTKIQNANVFVAADTGGPFPYRESVTIVNNGTTASVEHTGHGLATNDKVHFYGSDVRANEGVFTITVIDVDNYTYTMGSAPGVSPTDQPTATFVFLKGLTDVDGEISMSRVVSSTQPVYGWARKSTSSPLYKQGVISTNVSSSQNTVITAILSPDE